MTFHKISQLQQITQNNIGKNLKDIFAFLNIILVNNQWINAFLNCSNIYAVLFTDTNNFISVFLVSKYGTAFCLVWRKKPE